MGTFWAGVHVSKLIVRSAISFVLAACSAARLVPDLPDGRSDLISQGACGSLVPASQGGPMRPGMLRRCVGLVPRTTNWHITARLSSWIPSTSVLLFPRLK